MKKGKVDAALGDDTSLVRRAQRRCVALLSKRQSPRISPCPHRNASRPEVTFLRETGAAPIVKTYTVPATSRFNVDVNGVTPDLQNESVGFEIRVTNNVAIVVERSMYWDSGGVFFKGGTNATGVALP
jgi:hypothetical protein